MIFVGQKPKILYQMNVTMCAKLMKKCIFENKKKAIFKDLDYQKIQKAFSGDS